MDKKEIIYSGKKYLPLKEYLQSLGKNRIMLPHKEVEKIIKGKLPKSAYKYKEFWGNNRANGETADHSNSWLEAGWEVEKIDLEHEAIYFERKE
jgi:hypothetical protein